MAIIRAAGGLLWRTGKDGRRRLAVIHRPHREDWSLPKGKLKDGEHWEEAALREVEEETGCAARIVSFAGAVHYVPKRTPKVVLYWNMELLKEGPLQFLEEVDKVVWLTRGEALKRLDHDAERAVLVEALELKHFMPPEPVPAPPRRTARRPAARADRDRRAAESTRSAPPPEPPGPAGPSGPSTLAPPASAPAPAAQGDEAFFEEAETQAVRQAADQGGPESPPPLQLHARPRWLRPDLATSAAMIVAAVAGYLLGPPGAAVVALGAAALGGLAAGAAAGVRP